MTSKLTWTIWHDIQINVDCTWTETWHPTSRELCDMTSELTWTITSMRHDIQIYVEYVTYYIQITFPERSGKKRLMYNWRLAGYVTYILHPDSCLAMLQMTSRFTRTLLPMDRIIYSRFRFYLHDASCVQLRFAFTHHRFCKLSFFLNTNYLLLSVIRGVLWSSFFFCHFTHIF